MSSLRFRRFFLLGEQNKRFFSAWGKQIFFGFGNFFLFPQVKNNLKFCFLNQRFYFAWENKNIFSCLGKQKKIFFQLRKQSYRFLFAWENKI